MKSNLEYLIGAYSAVWIVLTFFIFFLIHKTQRLKSTLKDLEKRLEQLEKPNNTPDS